MSGNIYASWLSSFIPESVPKHLIRFIDATGFAPPYLPNLIYVVFRGAPDQAGLDLKIRTSREGNTLSLDQSRPFTQVSVQRLNKHFHAMPRVTFVDRHTRARSLFTLFRDQHETQNTWIPDPEWRDPCGMIAYNSMSASYVYSSSEPLFRQIHNIIYTPLALSAIIESLRSYGLAAGFLGDTPVPPGLSTVDSDGDSVIIPTAFLFSGLTEAITGAAAWVAEFNQVPSNLHKEWPSYRQRMVRASVQRLAKQAKSIAGSMVLTQQKMNRRQAELASIMHQKKLLQQAADASLFEREGKALENFSHDKLKSCALYADSLLAITKQVVIKYNDLRFDMGRYGFSLDLNTSKLEVQLIEAGEDTHKLGSCIHPHIRETGDPCLGNVGIGLVEHVSEGRITEAVSLIIRYLESYNPADAYVNLLPPREERDYDDDDDDDDEEYEWAACCGVCGAGVDDYYTCETCGDFYCYDCAPDSHGDTVSSFIGPQYNHLLPSSFNRSGYFCTESCAIASLDLRCATCDELIIPKLSPGAQGRYTELDQELQKLYFNDTLLCPNCHGEALNDLA